MERENEHIYKAVDIAMRIGFISLLIIWCFNILRPLIVTISWGMIIAVGVYPLYLRLSNILKNRRQLSAVIISLTGILILVVPSGAFLQVTMGNIQSLVGIMEGGDLDIDLPYETIRGLPLVGEAVYEILDHAAENIEEVFEQFSHQIRALAPRVLSLAAGAGLTILQFIISIIAAGVFLVNADKSKRGADRVFSILVGEYVEEFPTVAAASIRSVVQGVLGIAVIQAVFSSIGMFVMGVPGAGILSILVLIVSIIQLPPFLILLPVAGYVFATASTLTAVIYLIWSIFVGLIDNILKPILLGRGVDVPTLVVLMGAIGGMISQGIIGLFVGPVVLVLGYKVLEALIEKNLSERRKRERMWTEKDI